MRTGGGCIHMRRRGSTYLEAAARGPSAPAHTTVVPDQPHGIVRRYRSMTRLLSFCQLARVVPLASKPRPFGAATPPPSPPTSPRPPPNAAETQIIPPFHPQSPTTTPQLPAMPASPTTTTASSDPPAPTLDDLPTRPPPGIILPSATARTIIEKTAGYVARNGASFEDRLRHGESRDKVTFLEPEDAYYDFYRWRVSEIKAGRGTAVSAGRDREETTGGVGGTGVSGKGKKGPDPPAEFVFSARVPTVNARDLDVVKLTALFVAKNGRGWMTGLSQREAGNFQFDFLRPQHTLYQFFTRLVDQYTILFTTFSDGGGGARAQDLASDARDRSRVLGRARARAEWARHQEARKAAQEEEVERERIAYHQIDWQDFVVVETVVFDERDAEVSLPAPPTKNDLQSASLEQKAAMSIDPSRRLEEAMPTFEDQAAWEGGVQQREAHAATPVAAAATTAATPYRPAVPPPAPPAPKIRPHHHPASARPNAVLPPNTSICPNCGQTIPNAEIQEHMRIELLDPAWRDQHRLAQQRGATTNLSTADVAGNLKRLASQRGDVFEEAVGKRREGG